ncbi:MAG: CHASE2 domain-containing protein [Paludibacteraceae bacterium]|nr:CHASE2 domain-containing protein [Paludibacteraceae bacterium]
MVIISQKWRKVKSGNAFRYTLKTLIVTIVSALLTLWCLPELLELTSVFSARGQEDFSITDFYNRLAVETIDKCDAGEVVCLNYEGSERIEIARLLDVLVSGKETERPAVVALDFYFPSVKNNDEILIEAMRRCAAKSRLVLPYIVKYNEDGTFSSDMSSYFNDTLACDSAGHFSTAVINLAGNYFTDVMRDFRYDFSISDSNRNFTMLSMPAQIAVQKHLADNMCDADSLLPMFEAAVAEHFIDAKNHHVIINYITDTIFTYDAMCLLDTTLQHSDIYKEIMDMIAGKAVVVGSMNDVKDTYITPLPELQAGMMVHAYGADTLLARRYISQSPLWLSWVIAVLITLMFTYFNCVVTDYALEGGNSLVRILQFISMLVLIWGGYMLFAHVNIYVDFNLSIMMIATSAMTFDMYNGCLFICRLFRNRYAKHRQ